MSERWRHGLEVWLFPLTLLLFGSCFLLLGKETYPEQAQIRTVAFLGLFVAACPLFFQWIKNERWKQIPKSLILFALFLAYEIVRTFSALIAGGLTISTPTSLQSVPTDVYVQALILWAGYFAVFVLFFYFSLKKSRSLTLLKGMAWMCFILALHALPPLLQGQQSPYYNMAGKASGFFWPVLYELPWVKQYLLTRFTHVNVLGDLLNFGFFTSLAMAIYALHLRFMRTPAVAAEESIRKGGFALFLLYGTMTIAIASAILVLFSRGTIVSFSFSLVIFFSFFSFFYARKKPAFLAGIVLLACILLGLIAWAGNFSKAYKEVMTLTEESTQAGETVASMNRGRELARLIAKANPVWGIGTKRYFKVATSFDESWKPGMKLDYQHVTPMSHYLTLRCEEGVGAFFYFAFMAVWFLEVLWGLGRTRSYYKFTVSLCLMCSVLTVFIHASHNFLMQTYGISVVVYAVMALCLGILHKDFQHEQ